MELSKYKSKIPSNIYDKLILRIKELRPAQHKAIDAGLFDDKNLLICTPTASGKTLVAELAIMNAIFHDKGKCMYVVPLKALANEKFEFFKKMHEFKTAISSGDIDSDDSYLEKYDLIITTSEKFDSLIRHKTHWLSKVKVVIIDEIHLLNDASRGPTLEVLITILKDQLKRLQLIGLSATIGNPKDLASWLDAELIIDNWRPVKLHKGILLNSEIEFFEHK
ncbi:TPA: DEAD/DEAH box helicase [Candidatus Woesearchaeota archaeon]|nr:DEAD/DEAH box helicase [Candidatus Woesearchaeota archaeon]HIH31337.1 DEAD/DEAH box helicase [Candidatus Woesearchaeota archaeon]HIH55189.1 DEAD/DEAH box helicase [Candidatus Woesearchaeota archaeon]HIJ02038.1 DEAD/DEAH box helicase [Candidatus Woesearchaeota archaeon]HIJ13633.1 DEAD/DEAH box helicase [Candidatus Woesearchaeota archaeon]